MTHLIWEGMWVRWFVIFLLGLGGIVGVSVWAQDGDPADIPAIMQIEIAWFAYLIQNPDEAQVLQLELNRRKVVDSLLLALEKRGFKSGIESNRLGYVDISWLVLLLQNPKERDLWQLELEKLALIASIAQLLESRGFRPDVVSPATDRVGQLKGAALLFLERPYEVIELLAAPARRAKATLDACRIESPGTCGRALEDIKEYDSLIARAVEMLAQQGRFDEAIDVFTPVAVSEYRKEEQDLSKILRLLRIVLLEMFRSISWDPSSSQLITGDPADFMGMHYIDVGKRWKYGTMSEDEDYATFATMVRMSRLVHITRADPNSVEENPHLQELLEEYSSANEDNWNIDKYVTQQLSLGNLEPVAKYMYFTALRPFFRQENGKFRLSCSPPQHSGQALTFATVRQTVLALPGATTSPQTIKVLEQMNRTREFLNALCDD